MLAAQGGKCKICRKRPARLYIDHDHETFKLRGLLCVKCNCGIGCFDDNPRLLKAAQQYVEDNRASINS
jgi:hypothetical protein